MNNMTSRFLFLLSIIITALVSTAAAQPLETAKWVGSNYTPAYACNQVQFWHDFRADVVDKELAAAKKYFAINTLRVYLHSINFEQDKENFFKNLETFLTICDKHGIKPGFTFFDDCHRHEDIFLNAPTEPVKGYHNGRWAASPQDRDRDINNLERYKPYLQEVIGKYKDDDRVLWWETFNEPKMKNAWSVAMRKASYQFAKEMKPKQPVICCWDDSPETDIVNAHNYSLKDWDKQADLNPVKGCVFTEAGARWFAPKPSSGEPVEVIHWLEQRKRDKKYTPGVYLCWELMVGNSNCRWYWGTPENTPEPTVPWCGLLWSDGTPVSLAEAEAVRRYVTGKSKALLFDNFQNVTDSTKQPETEKRGEWTIYNPNTPVNSGVCKLSPNSKMIAGDENWTDYVLESVVMLTEERGNAGLVFRVSQPGTGQDDFHGYYAGFDTKTLYLGKMVKGKWQQLTTYDLTKLDCKVKTNVWNQIRVAIEGNRIRVWFNRMHESADKENGLRIDYTDPEPIPKGNVGMRTFQTMANFDNFIVLPID
ncbi:hypothetical protein FACS189454_06290 [Planctomycetales bacterium]|nr:hypothetical protein FACS189454_06290 [Planctomycetales bacterium]